MSVPISKPGLRLVKQDDHDADDWYAVLEIHNEEDRKKAIVAGPYALVMHEEWPALNAVTCPTWMRP